MQVNVQQRLDIGQVELPHLASRVQTGQAEHPKTPIKIDREQLETTDGGAGALDRLRDGGEVRKPRQVHLFSTKLLKNPEK